MRLAPVVPTYECAMIFLYRTKTASLIDAQVSSHFFVAAEAAYDIPLGMQLLR
jgi:hypothetical protein